MGASLAVTPADGAAVELHLAAYNAQVWGVTKAGKAEVVERTVAIIRRYHMVFFQEIRDASQTAIFVLLDAVNAAVAADGREYHYDMLLSPRLGRTSSKEQYAYIFRNNSVVVDSAGVFDESLLSHADVFEREPYLASFRVLGAAASAPLLDFVGIHVKPSDAIFELGNMSAVLDTRPRPAIVLGDLNADCSYLSVAEATCCVPLYADPDYTWLIDWSVDTTVKSTHCAYDRFILPAPYLPFLRPGSAVPFDFAAAFGLDAAAAEDVSDHYPIELVLDYPAAEAVPPGPPPPPPPSPTALPPPPASTTTPASTSISNGTVPAPSPSPLVTSSGAVVIAAAIGVGCVIVTAAVVVFILHRKNRLCFAIPNYDLDTMLDAYGPSASEP
ncbi:deoxyribonuclease-1 [Thecamonas trahens ATCC 50062]|uniref:Deoxyribonuclease-1 n=1 Tax=Thecamonas trahens ATCC 50062 TaxID=461836 RepID=A0A0L0DV74_THETB|nr:deoxyribonuclease-1 [Thecamonas trahens ATCC 50062]KNC56115.1 deoxyribonuclease-1 [Thecamonas trahens ATCC 50062]|eukprot:XP_013761157.1 deoxyribonuclease-1 [Thecamonas trahens ATCC 50062]